MENNDKIIDNYKLDITNKKLSTIIDTLENLKLSRFRWIKHTIFIDFTLIENEKGGNHLYRISIEKDFNKNIYSLHYIYSFQIQLIYTEFSVNDENNSNFIMIDALYNRVISYYAHRGLELLHEEADLIRKEYENLMVVKAKLMTNAK